MCAGIPMGNDEKKQCGAPGFQNKVHVMCVNVGSGVYVWWSSSNLWEMLCGWTGHLM